MAGGKAKINSSKNYPQKKGFCAFIYDSDEGTVMGRTFGSWVKIVIFYLVFYTCLAAFFCFNYYVFSRTLVDNRPKWILGESIIGTNPGIGFRPMPDQDANAESTLIWFNSANDKDASFWYNQLTKMKENTFVAPGTPGTKECNYEGETATKSEACRVDLSNLGPCTPENTWGYKDGKPCVLIKLNKIYAWEPEPFGLKENGKYDETTLRQDLEEQVKEKDMPENLKTFIENEVKKNPGNEANILSTVWISCVGEGVGDKENLPPGHVSYYPKRGIPGYYFPYWNQKMYKSPYILIHFDLPQSSRHILINVECRAWAKNIQYSRAERLGSVHFELMVD